MREGERIIKELKRAGVSEEKVSPKELRALLEVDPEKVKARKQAQFFRMPDYLRYPWSVKGIIPINKTMVDTTTSRMPS